MKKFILILFILIIYYAQAQTYRPFPSKNGYWFYRYFDDYHNSTPYNTQYNLTDDTILLSTTYKKIFMNSLYAGGIRESQKKVYFIPDTASKEYLLYDFNLSVGDTIIHPFGGAYCSNDTITVAFVDSILASDGYHRQIFFDSSPPWIEGIGSSAYLLEPNQIACVSGNDFIECMSSDTIFHYPDGSSYCFVSIFEQHNSNSNISIFPNPSNDSFTIDFLDVKIKELFVTDVLGNLILYLEPILDSRMKIEPLQSGVYFITIIDSNNRIITKKLISSR